jgi:predicted RNase H-like HicB family nuclease
MGTGTDTHYAPIGACTIHERGYNMMRSLNYRILLRKEPEGGYTVIVPTLPGCVTFGETVDEAIAMAREAVRTIHTVCAPARSTSRQEHEPPAPAHGCDRMP